MIEQADWSEFERESEREFVKLCRRLLRRQIAMMVR